MVILGSTGSIGVNALKVTQQFSIKIEALVCNNNITLLNEQIRQFQPKFVGVADEKVAHLVKKMDSILFIGEEGIIELLNLCQSPRILNAIIGYAGLNFSLKILSLKKELILANKESLVIAGGLLQQIIRNSYINTDIPHCLQQYNPKHSSSQINNTLKFSNTNVNTEQIPLIHKIFPIDSEHFSLYSLLYHDDINNIQNKFSKPFKNLYVTASGGAQRDFSLDRIPNATLHDVLQHPTWNMGQKITIDSATLVNKLYETLEAFWLFNTKNIHALIERGSLIHAMVEFMDNSLAAHISHADMRLPIAYGLDFAKANKIFHIKQLELKDFTKIQFREIDINRYPLWQYKELLLEKPHLGIALNTSNEFLQHLFLQEKIPFCTFDKLISEVLNHFQNIKNPNTLQEILDFRTETLQYSQFLLK